MTIFLSIAPFFTTNIFLILEILILSQVETCRYIMTTGCLIMEIDILTSLCFGTFKAKRIGKLFERISRLHGSVREMRSIRQQIQIVLMILLTLFLLSIVSYFHVAYIRFNGFYSINWQNFSGNSPLLVNLITLKNNKNFVDSPPGILIRGIISIVMQIQCALVVTLCLLISSKFQYLAETIKITLERATLYSSCEQTNTVRIMNVSTIKWTTIETNTVGFYKTGSRVALNHVVEKYILVFSHANFAYFSRNSVVLKNILSFYGYLRD